MLYILRICGGQTQQQQQQHSSTHKFNLNLFFHSFLHSILLLAFDSVNYAFIKRALCMGVNCL